MTTRANEGRGSRRRPHVLWIDDHPLMRRTLELLAPELDVELHVAAGEEEVHAFFASGAVVDCVVCDYYLQGKSSVALIRSLKSSGQRILIFTGAFADSLEGIPGVHILEKPMAIKEVLEHVRREIGETRGES